MNEVNDENRNVANVQRAVSNDAKKEFREAVQSLMEEPEYEIVFYVGGSKDPKPSKEIVKKMEFKLPSRLAKRYEMLESKLGSFMFRDPATILQHEFNVMKRKRNLDQARKEALFKHHSKVYKLMQMKKTHKTRAYDDHYLDKFCDKFPKIHNYLLASLTKYHKPSSKSILAKYSQIEKNRAFSKSVKSLNFDLKNEERKLKYRIAKIYQSNFNPEEKDVQDLQLKQKISKWTVPHEHPHNKDIFDAKMKDTSLRRNAIMKDRENSIHKHNEMVKQRMETKRASRA